MTTRIQVPNSWIEYLIHPSTFQAMFKRIKIPDGVDMSDVRFDMPGWVMARTHMPEAFLADGPKHDMWDIHMVFDNEADAVMWKLKYSQHL